MGSVVATAFRRPLTRCCVANAISGSPGLCRDGELELERRAAGRNTTGRHALRHGPLQNRQHPAGAWEHSIVAGSNRWDLLGSGLRRLHVVLDGHANL